MHELIKPPVPAVQAVDAIIEAITLSQRRLDIDTTMVKLDGIGSRNGLDQIDRIASGLECIQMPAQAFMKVHRCCIDIIEAGGEPQSRPVELRCAVLSTD